MSKLFVAQCNAKEKNHITERGRSTNTAHFYKVLRLLIDKDYSIDFSVSKDSNMIYIRN
jgi:hypothetical protein